MTLSDEPWVANTGGIQLSALLSEWRWLVDARYRPLFVTALGDMFLERDDGRVFRLATGSAELLLVAASPEELQRLLEDSQQREAWLDPALMAALIRQYGALPPGQCFSSRVPPALGGSRAPDNFEPASLLVHFGLLGQIYRQVKDLPPGTPISSVRIVEPGAANGFGDPTLRRKQRIAGVGMAVLSAGFIVWTWHTALHEGYYYRNAALIFPAFFALGAGMVLFPDYRTERLARGEEISHLSGSQLLTPRWWGIVAVGLLAGVANWFLLSR